MTLFFILPVILLLLIPAIAGQEKPYYEVETNLMKSLFMDSTYDREVAPQMNKSIAVKLEMSLSLNSLLEIVSMKSYCVDCYIFFPGMFKLMIDKLMQHKGRYKKVANIIYLSRYWQMCDH